MNKKKILINPTHFLLFSLRSINILKLTQYVSMKEGLLFLSQSDRYVWRYSAFYKAEMAFS